MQCNPNIHSIYKKLEVIRDTSLCGAKASTCVDVITGHSKCKLCVATSYMEHNLLAIPTVAQANQHFLSTVSPLQCTHYHSHIFPRFIHSLFFHLLLSLRRPSSPFPSCYLAKIVHTILNSATGNTKFQAASE